MSKTEEDYIQPIGLDVGTSRIVAARKTEKGYRYDSQLNAFLTLPYSKLAVSLLQKEHVFHEVRGDEIVVVGNDAEKFAEVFHADVRRPMANGVLNPAEMHSLSVVRRIIKELIGTAGVEGQKVFFSVPAPSAAGDLGLTYHSASIGQILTELNFTATPIEEGLSVVFGELSASNYSGIGISCGSGLCNVCLAVLAVPVFSFSVPKAGDYIDAQSALVTGDLATRIRVQKEQSCTLNGLSGNRVNNALTIYYREMIMNLVDHLRTQVSSSHRLPKFNQSVPLVLSGGTAMPKGFLEQFSTAMDACDFPIKLSEIRLSPDPLNATARGALMAAIC
jgi:hypothetical protein